MLILRIFVSVVYNTGVSQNLGKHRGVGDTPQATSILKLGAHPYAITEISDTFILLRSALIFRLVHTITTIFDLPLLFCESHKI